MRAASLLLAFSLGLLLSGLLVAAIKPRASVDREHGAYHVPGARALVYLLSPGASYSRMLVEVSCSGDARVVLAAVSVEHLAKGAAAVLGGVIQSLGPSAVIVGEDLAREVLGSETAKVLVEGGPGRYDVGGAGRPVILVVFPGDGGIDVEVSLTRYNLLVSVMSEKRLGLASSAAALAALVLLLRER